MPVQVTKLSTNDQSPHCLFLFPNSAIPNSLTQSFTAISTSVVTVLIVYSDQYQCCQSIDILKFVRYRSVFDKISRYRYRFFLSRQSRCEVRGARGKNPFRCPSLSGTAQKCHSWKFFEKAICALVHFANVRVIFVTHNI